MKKLIPLFVLIAIAIGSWWAHTQFVEVEAVSSQGEQTQRDAKRYDELYAEGTATKREAEEAAMTEDVRKREVDESASLAVSAKGFCKRYGKTVAVDAIDINIRKGEIYGLIGPDGAGKSSFMKAVAGVLSFEAGTLQVFDTMVDSEASAEKVKQRIGFMPQGLGLNMYPDLSVEESIDFSHA